MIKLEQVKIIQIVFIKDTKLEENKIFGLGDDSFIYKWSPEERKWTEGPDFI